MFLIRKYCACFKEYFMNNKLPNRINFLLFIVALFLSLLIKFDPPLWQGYDDAYDYIHQSHQSLLDKSFYFPERKANFYPRPFTVPLFYKMGNSDPETIIIMQKNLHAFCTFFLGYVVLLFLKTTQSKIIFLISWYLLMMWWNILSWTNMLLSESLSISFMFLWIASFLLVFYKRKILPIIFHVLIILLFSFTRDSWPYILIIFYGMFTIIALFWDKKMVKNSVIFLLLSCSIFVVQHKSAQIGQRYRLPIMNNVVFRIVPNKEYLQWFSDVGMPCVDQLKKHYSNLHVYEKIYPIYTDLKLSKFSDWAGEEGSSIYTKFIILHPSYLFMLNEKQADLDRIFAYDIVYTDPDSKYSLIGQYIFPLFNTSIILLLNVFLIYLFIKEKRVIWLLPSVLIAIFTFNAFLLYIADSMEVERHLFVTNIMIQFVGILSCCFILDSELCNRILNKRKKFNNG